MSNDVFCAKNSKNLPPCRIFDKIEWITRKVKNNNTKETYDQLALSLTPSLGLKMASGLNLFNIFNPANDAIMAKIKAQSWQEIKNFIKNDPKWAPYKKNEPILKQQYICHFNKGFIKLIIAGTWNWNIEPEKNSMNNLTCN